MDAFAKRRVEEIVNFLAGLFFCGIGTVFLYGYIDSNHKCAYALLLGSFIFMFLGLWLWYNALGYVRIKWWFQDISYNIRCSIKKYLLKKRGKKFLAQLIESHRAEASIIAQDKDGNNLVITNEEIPAQIEHLQKALSAFTDWVDDYFCCLIGSNSGNWREWIRIEVYDSSCPRHRKIAEMALARTESHLVMYKNGGGYGGEEAEVEAEFEKDIQRRKKLCELLGILVGDDEEQGIIRFLKIRRSLSKAIDSSL